ncbi:hypothetical protein RAMLITH_02785 [Ramlibacter sp. RBP-2]|uniref:Bacteriocin n=1 Tax=Ramlibacter lithotrophicus TaxID=2606681 RepID=A0A7X6DCN1_9BURK|nr:hypothetical protein [Ramlibacter lithotrophicus]NKE64737.1 hypothetical protein [Ramlibacter lithotrophicus]
MRTDVQTHSTQTFRDLSAQELLAVGGGLYIVDDGSSAGGGGAWDSGADYGWTADSGFGTGSGPADYSNTITAVIDVTVNSALVFGGPSGVAAGITYSIVGGYVMDSASTSPNGMISDIYAP